MTIQEKKESLKNINIEEAATQAAILGAEEQDKKTLEYKKEAVRQFIVRAVPSVMDLVFGCVVKHTQHGWKQRIISNLDFNSHGRYLTDGTGAGTNIIKLPSKKWEIIGRPITLFDTSKIVKDKHTLIDIWTEGSLDNQSDENIEWIHSNMVD